MISVKTLVSFFKSPLNVVGFVFAILTAADAGYTEYLTHTLNYAVLIPGTISSLFLMIFPDSTVVASDIKQVITDGLLDWASKDPASLSTLLNDVVKLVEDT